MNRSRKLFKTFVLCFCTVAVLLCCVNVSAEPEGEIPFKTGNIKQEADGGYVLYDNYTKFNGTVYEYDLNEFFPDSTLTVYTYTITSEYPEEGAISIDENILRITPHSQMTDTIVITATGLAGEVVEIPFRLNFVDSFQFVLRKAMWLLVLSFVLLILAAVINLPSVIDGRIVIFVGGKEPKTIHSDKDGKRFIKIGPGFGVKGIILGGKRDYILFIPFEKTYVKRGSLFEKIFCEKIEFGEKSMKTFSLGEPGSNRIIAVKFSEYV